MGWHRRGKRRSRRTVGVFAVAMLMSSSAYGPIAPRGIEWSAPPQGDRSRVSGSFELMPLTTERKGDRVVLKNGDSLTGEVLGIGEETVHFEAEMVEGTVNMPFGSLSRVEFKRRMPRESEGSDEVLLVEGGRFRASIAAMNVRNLSLRTFSRSDSGETALETNKVASIALDPEPLVLLRDDFTDEDHVSFVVDGGEWVVGGGRFSAIGARGSSPAAHARVRQWGRMRYVWTLDNPRGRNSRVHILSSGRHTVWGGVINAYGVEPGYDWIAVSKVTKNAESQRLSFPIDPVKSKATFRVDYDCETGQMQICLDGRQVANLKDKEPIRSGEYVILGADGKADFDDFQVENLGGGSSLLENEEGKDLVVLRNGDRIAGHVKELSGREVVVVQEGGERELRPDREKVWQIVFGGRSSSPAKGDSIVFWDDNRLAGKVSSLTGHVLALETQAIGELKFDVGRVKTIILEE